MATTNGQSKKRANGNGLTASQRKLVDDVAKSAVHETLTTLGFDTSDPIKSQETSAAIRKMAEHYDDPEFRHDMYFLRRTRKFVTSVRVQVVGALVFLGVTGVWSSAIEYAKRYWNL